LPNIYELLHSIPSTGKERKEGRERGREEKKKKGREKDRINLNYCL
jgi:hypothetical protein